MDSSKMDSSKMDSSNSSINPQNSVQKLILEPDTLRFRVPFAMVISGPSQGGKSEFILNLIKNREYLFTSRFHRIIYCAPEAESNKVRDFFQRIKNEFTTAELWIGLPNLQRLHLKHSELPSLIIMGQ
jgi:hypothetical protein